MRNAFVILVSLCIRLVSGFIVPSSVPEQRTEKNTIFNTDTITELAVKSTTSTKYGVLPDSRSNIDEDDLYEHATEKKNNQSQRAFVYINQKYNKSPFRSKLVKMLPIDRLDYPYAFITGVTAVPALTSDAQTPCPSAFDSLSNFKSKFQGFNLGDNRERQEISSYFSAPNLFRCKFNEVSKKKEIPKVTKQMQQSQRVDERRDYFELLKPPILRPVNRKVNYENNNKNGLPSLISSRENREDYIKGFNSKNQYVSQSHEAAMARQNEIRKNYGFNGPFIRRPSYQPKELTNRVEEANFEDEFINDDDYRRNFENNQEEDKLLDKYLKDTLEDVPLMNMNDKMRGNVPDCTQDCVLETRKKPPKISGLLIKPDCQCGKTPSVKQVEAFITKDRTLREESERNNTTATKSSEVIYYEDVLSDDSNMIKHDDEVIRPPRRINVTTFH